MDKAYLQKLILDIGYESTLKQVKHYLQNNTADFRKRISLFDESLDVLSSHDRISIAKKNVADFSSRPLPHIKAIQLLVSENQYDEAFQYLNEALALHPTNRHLHHKSLMLHLQFQNWNQAEISLQVLETHWPSQDSAHLRLLFNIRAKRQKLPINLDDHYVKNLNNRQRYRLQTMFKGYTSMLALCQQGIAQDDDTLWWKIQQLKLYIITRKDKVQINQAIRELAIERNKLKKYKKQLIQIAQATYEYKSEIVALLDNQPEEFELPILTSKTQVHVENTQVDIVYTWADMGEDVLREQFTNVTGINPLTSVNEQQNITRHISDGEILLSLLTVEKYFPEVRTIFIVTPNQTFSLSQFSASFRSKIKFVNQDDILPSFLVGKVFNSTLIETFIHLIPDLSETFLYFCDDYFLGNTIQHSDLFHDDGIAKINMLRRDLKIHTHVSKVSSTYVNKAIPIMYVENARQLFLHSYGIEPNLTFPHQAMIMNRSAFKICLDLYHKAWENTFYKEFTRGKNTVHTLTLISWISIHNGFQRLNDTYDELSEAAAFHFGFTEENVDYILTVKPKYFCINNLSNEYSKKNFQLLFKHFKT